MNANDRTTLSLAIPKLTSDLKLTPRFKAALLSADVLPEGFLDHVFQVKPDGEAVFRIVQRLKRIGGDAFDQFIKVLVVAEQNVLIDYLSMLRSHSEIKPTACGTLRPKTRNVHGQSRSARKKRENCRTDNSNAAPNASLHRQDASGFSQNLPGSGDSNSRPPSEQPLEGLRKTLKDCKRFFVDGTQSGDAMMTQDFAKRLSMFSRGKSDTHPGAFEPPDATKIAIPNAVVGTVAPAYCAELCKLLGGKPNLYFDDRHGIHFLTDIHRENKFVECAFCIQPDKHCVFAFLALQTPVEECAASILGFYPSRMCYHGESSERELSKDETVAEWFDKSSKTGIDVWP